MAFISYDILVIKSSDIIQQQIEIISDYVEINFKLVEKPNIKTINRFTLDP